MDQHYTFCLQTAPSSLLPEPSLILSGAGCRHTTGSRPKMAHIVMDSPLGPLIITEEEGFVKSIDWSGRIPGGDGQATEVLLLAQRELNEYFAGERKAFTFPYRLSGTAFRQDVYRALMAVPYGETVTYGELAKRSGHPGAARAVGNAMNQNKLPLLVPCHRVCSKQRPYLFGGGEWRKKWLFRLEGIRF